MNDIEHNLHGVADSFDLPPGDVQAVVERGQARQTRRRRLVATTTAMALVATSVAGLRLLSAGDPTTTLAAGGAAVLLGDDAVAWEKVDPSSVLSLVQPNPVTTSPSGRLYALSTAPGEADLGQTLRKVVWQSDDGVGWSATGSSDDIFLADLAASDDRLYAVGTGAATAAVAGGRTVPPLVVGWSDDGAGSWQTTTLDIDLPAIAGASRSVRIDGGLAIATGTSGTVAAIGLQADLDIPRFLPEGVSAPNGWSYTSSGVALLGPAPGGCPGRSAEAMEAEPGRLWSLPCVDGEGQERYLPAREVRGVIDSFTWEELGVTGDVRQAALGQPMLFRAEPGSNEFERISLEETFEPGTIPSVALHAGADGFLIAVAEGDQGAESAHATVRQSTDGRSWSVPTVLPGGLARLQAAGPVGDTFVLIGDDQQGAAAVVVDDEGSGWRAVPLAELVGSEGPLPSFMGAAVGPEGIVATIGGLGQESDGRFEPHLLASGDARSWSVQSVEELIDEPVASVGQPVITGDRAVVPVAPIRPRGPDGHLEQVALVATLP